MPAKKESNEPLVEKLLNDFEEEAPELGFTDEQLECLGRTLKTALHLREEPAKAYWARLDVDRVRKERCNLKKSKAMTEVPTTPARSESSGSRKQTLLPKAASAMKRKTPNVARSKTAATTTKKKRTTFVATPTKTASRNLITEMENASEEKRQQVGEICHDKVELAELSPKTQDFLRLSTPDREDLIRWKACNTDFTGGVLEFAKELSRTQQADEERLAAAQASSNKQLFEAQMASRRKRDGVSDLFQDVVRLQLSAITKTPKKKEPTFVFGKGV